MSKFVSIAIDGPAGAGKSTMARACAQALGYLYVDTGAIYRTVGYYMRLMGVGPKDKDGIARLIDEVNIDIRYEDGAQVDYTYDNNGNLGLLTDSASGRRTQYFYDFQDRLMRWEQSGSGYENSVTWGYDDNNNLSTQKQTLNGTTYTTSYTYDKDNRLTKTTAGTVSAGYTYDALGRMTAMDAQNK